MKTSTSRWDRLKKWVHAHFPRVAALLNIRNPQSSAPLLPAAATLASPSQLPQSSVPSDSGKQGLPPASSPIASAPQLPAAVTPPSSVSSSQKLFPDPDSPSTTSDSPLPKAAAEVLRHATMKFKGANQPASTASKEDKAQKIRDEAISEGLRLAGATLQKLDITYDPTKARMESLGQQIYENAQSITVNSDGMCHVEHEKFGQADIPASLLIGATTYFCFVEQALSDVKEASLLSSFRLGKHQALLEALIYVNARVSRTSMDSDTQNLVSEVRARLNAKAAQLKSVNVRDCIAYNIASGKIGFGKDDKVKVSPNHFRAVAKQIYYNQDATYEVPITDEKGEPVLEADGSPKVQQLNSFQSWFVDFLQNSALKAEYPPAADMQPAQLSFDPDDCVPTQKIDKKIVDAVLASVAKAEAPAAAATAPVESEAPAVAASTPSVAQPAAPASSPEPAVAVTLGLPTAAAEPVALPASQSPAPSAPAASGPAPSAAVADDNGWDMPSSQAPAGAAASVKPAAASGGAPSAAKTQARPAAAAASTPSVAQPAAPASVALASTSAPSAVAVTLGLPTAPAEPVALPASQSPAPSAPAASGLAPSAAKTQARPAAAAAPVKPAAASGLAPSAAKAQARPAAAAASTPSVVQPAASASSPKPAVAVTPGLPTAPARPAALPASQSPAPSAPAASGLAPSAAKAQARPAAAAAPVKPAAASPTKPSSSKAGTGNPGAGQSGFKPPMPPSASDSKSQVRSIGSFLLPRQKQAAARQSPAGQSPASVGKK